MSSNTLLCTLIFGCLLIFSCTPEQEQSGIENNVNQEIIEFLIDNGYSKENIKIADGLVTVDDDASWSRDYFVDLFAGKLDEEIADPDNPDLSDDLESRQRGMSNRTEAINWYYADDVTYYIRPSVIDDCGATWYNAIHSAATQWSNVNGCQINFRALSSQSGADLIIGSHNDTGLPVGFRNLPAGAVAKADFPQYNRGGEWLSINDRWKNMGNNFATEHMLHEIGHTLGLHHTNRGTGTHIATTPHSDFQSVMNQNDGRNQTSLSHYDKVAIKAIYPSSLPLPIIGHLGKLGNENSLFVNLNMPDYEDQPYYKVRVQRYKTNGGPAGFKDYVFDPNSSGSFNAIWTGFSPGDKYYFTVKGINFRRDKYSRETARKFVQF